MFEEADALFLYLRLPGGVRLLVDSSREASPAPLDFLRRRGEVGPLNPLTHYLRPALKPAMADWIQVLSMARGLALRPGGSWVSWQNRIQTGDGFAFSARVFPAASASGPSCEMERSPLLVLGLSPEQIQQLGGEPPAWAANASLALLVASKSQPGRDLLLGGDLRADAWQKMLPDAELENLLTGVSCFGSGANAGVGDLSRGLLMACLPWLVIGALCREESWPPEFCSQERTRLSTPRVGTLTIDVDQAGAISVTGMPRRENRLTWSGLACPLDDPQLPPPWPLRKALGGAGTEGFSGAHSL